MKQFIYVTKAELRTLLRSLDGCEDNEAIELENEIRLIRDEQDRQATPDEMKRLTG